MERFKKIVVYDLEPDPLEESFLGELRGISDTVEVIFASEEFSGDLEKEDLEGADALIIHPLDSFDDELFEDSELEYIGLIHTDPSNVNAKTLEEEEITLTNVPGYSTEAVAELTISALLNITRRTYEAMKYVEEGKWGYEGFMASELKGKKLGVIGMGRIGRRVGEIARGFGMDVNYYSRTRKPELEDKFTYMELDEILKKNDVISLHCSLNEHSKNILDNSKLEKMKDGSILLNSAREELMDLDALYKVCKEGKISAWMDELHHQKWREKFKELDNVYLTPDIGWLTEEAQNRLKEIAIENIKQYLKGNPQNIVTGT